MSARASSAAARPRHGESCLRRRTECAISGAVLGSVRVRRRTPTVKLPKRLMVVARQLNHFDDMSADVVAAQGPCCCDPMMAVENVVLAVPCPHLDGRERLALAHGDQYVARRARARSLTGRKFRSNS